MLEINIRFIVFFIEKLPFISKHIFFFLLKTQQYTAVTMSPIAPVVMEQFKLI